MAPQKTPLSNSHILSQSPAVGLPQFWGLPNSALDHPMVVLSANLTQWLNFNVKYLLGMTTNESNSQQTPQKYFFLTSWDALEPTVSRPGPPPAKARTRPRHTAARAGIPYALTPRPRNTFAIPCLPTPNPRRDGERTRRHGDGRRGGLFLLLGVGVRHRGRTLQTHASRRRQLRRREPSRRNRLWQ